MNPRRRTSGRAAKRAPARRPPAISRFARSLVREWRRLQLPVSNETIIVAVSGGADSVALLLGLNELVRAKKLKVRIVVAHVDHRLRKTSNDDARWVKRFGRQFGFTVSVSRVTVRTKDDNLEQAARHARYRSLSALAQKRRARVVLTAHTMDDLAETVMLNLLRGSGADGLSGMQPVRPLNESGEVLLARPLLSWARRRDTEQYCRAREIEARRDEMNEDETFARVRVRRRLLPLMESFNPRIAEALVRTSGLLHEDNQALTSGAGRLLELSMERSTEGKRLRIDLLAAAGPALRRRALRLWLEECRGDLRRLELVHVQAVADLVTQNRGGRVIELPGGSSVSLKHGVLTFNRRTSARPKT